MPSDRTLLPGVLTHLGDLSVEQFLQEYWQRKPLLVRQALPDFHSPVSPEELAGLALEEAVESRLITETATGNPLESQWTLEHGPLQEAHFANLPQSHWTLLVQAVDQLVPEVGNLLNRLRFIPNWRLDDIMISYATDGGSVGPHFDYYDVFLLQAHGKRRWRLGQHCDSNTPLRPDTSMSLLCDFETDAEYLLEPGDMLYIPPHKAHWGIAEGDCMTYSIGFRAPSYSDLLLDYSAELASQLHADQRYTDAGLALLKHPGEIAPDAIERVQSILFKLLTDRERIGHWLASYGTSAKRTAPEPEEPALPDADTASRLVALKSRVRAAYIPVGKDLSRLYLDGCGYPCSLPLAQALSSYRVFDVRHYAQSHDQTLLAESIDQRWLVCHD